MPQKGHLAKNDLKRRLIFAPKYQKLPTKFCTEGISFYLDEADLVHKTKPMESVRTDRTRTWKKKCESWKAIAQLKEKKKVLVDEWFASWLLLHKIKMW